MKKIITALSMLAVSITAYATTPNSVEKEIPMKNYTVIQKPSMIVMGIECRTSNNPDAGPKDIPNLWQKFFNEDILNKIPNKASSDVIGLYCDYAGDCTQPYSLVIGCEVTSLNEIPKGMVAKTLPASTYALFSATGDFPKSVIDTWGTIWQTNLDRTYTGDFEIYGDKYSKGKPQEVEICIAIEPVK